MMPARQDHLGGCRNEDTHNAALDDRPPNDQSILKGFDSFLRAGECSSTGDSILAAERFTLGLEVTIPVLLGFLALVHALSYVALSKLYRARA